MIFYKVKLFPDKEWVVLGKSGNTANFEAMCKKGDSYEFMRFLSFLE
jgi:hypothetical protein